MCNAAKNLQRAAGTCGKGNVPTGGDQNARRYSPGEPVTDESEAAAVLVTKAPVGTQTLMRGLLLLECVAEGISDVKSITARLGTPRSTTHRMLGSLVAEGYLHHVPYQGYLLGPKLLRLGIKAQEQRPIGFLARPHLETLSEATKDTVHLGVMEGEEIFYLDKISGSRGLEMRSRIGQRRPLATTGLGKSMMLGMRRASWKRLYDLALADFVPGAERPQPRPWAEYEADLLSYRAQGWVYDIEENEFDIRCVGAPVRDISGSVVAAISVASAILYMPDSRMAELGPLVKSAADAISGTLGWRG